MCKYISCRKSSSDQWSYNNKTLICFSQWLRCSKVSRADTHSSPHNSNLAPLPLFILISMEVECSGIACVPRYNHVKVFIEIKVKIPGVSNVSLFGISHWMNVTIPNKFRLESHYQAKVYRKCMLIFSLSGMQNMKS